MENNYKRKGRRIMENKINNYDEKKNAYEDKKGRRIERYTNRAKKAKIESNQAFNSADKLSNSIPLGQPILVGHHSEKRHRKDIGRIQKNMSKGIELNDKADYYIDKLQAAKNNTAISSNDPDAVIKLKEEIDIIEKHHADKLKMNKEYRKYLKDNTYEMQLSEIEIKAVLHAMEESKRLRLGHDLPFPSYDLTSDTTKIRNKQKRIDHLLKFAKQESTGEYNVEDLPDYIKFEKDTINNLFKIFIPKDKYSSMPELKELFKHNGFHFSGYNGCFQRMLSNIGCTEKHIAEELKKVFERRK